jgi:predicted nucleotide-binding protein
MPNPRLEDFFMAGVGSGNEIALVPFGLEEERSVEALEEYIGSLKAIKLRDDATFSRLSHAKEVSESGEFDGLELSEKQKVVMELLSAIRSVPDSVKEYASNREFQWLKFGQLLYETATCKMKHPNDKTVLPTLAAGFQLHVRNMEIPDEIRGMLDHFFKSASSRRSNVKTLYEQANRISRITHAYLRGIIDNGDASEDLVMTTNADPKRVFVVHGRNERARSEFYYFLWSVGLKPIEFEQAIALTKKGAPFVGEVLGPAFGAAQAVIVLLTGDDEARLKQYFWAENDPPHEKELTPQLRPNVLFEAGMAFGIHPDKTIFVEVNFYRPFTDIAGRHVIRVDAEGVWRHKLVERLRNAGCEVDTTGSAWLSAGKLLHGAK